MTLRGLPLMLQGRWAMVWRLILFSLQQDYLTVHAGVGSDKGLDLGFQIAKQSRPSPT
jgi:hypothetical protein